LQELAFFFPSGGKKNCNAKYFSNTEFSGLNFVITRAIECGGALSLLKPFADLKVKGGATGVYVERE
jgi:hypothetical protein